MYKKRPLAVMTMVRGDHHWARLWLEHYLKHVQSRRDIYVIIHGADEELAEIFKGCSVNFAPVADEGQENFEWKRLDFEHFFVRGLQAYFHCVLLVDIDEFVFPAPGIDAPLSEYLPDIHQGEMVRSSLGFEVFDDMTQPHTPLDLSKPILGQRPLAYCNAQYSKPCAFYFNFGAGTHHRIFGAPWIIDPDLLLFHMRYCDRELRREYMAQRKGYYSEQKQAGRATSGSWARPREMYKKLVAQAESFPRGVLDTQTRQDLRKFMLRRFSETNFLGEVASGLLTLPPEYHDKV